jgi:hypothetical protein
MDDKAENNSAGWELVVSFSGLYPTMEQEHAFVHGVEYGMLWNRIQSGQEAEIEGTFHVSNRTVIERTCASQGWDVEFSKCEAEGQSFDEWLFAKLTKKKAAIHNQHGLRIVGTTSPEKPA